MTNVTLAQVAVLEWTFVGPDYPEWLRLLHEQASSNIARRKAERLRNAIRDDLPPHLD